MNTVDPRFRALLVNLMTAHGVNVGTLAMRAAINADHVSEIVNGAAMPSAEDARAIDEALDAGGRLAELATEGDG
jgi:hypothetical protein